jgi:hypothetical protein
MIHYRVRQVFSQGVSEMPKDANQYRVETVERLTEQEAIALMNRLNQLSKE